MGCGPPKKPFTFANKHLWSFVFRIAVTCIILTEALSLSIADNLRHHRQSDQLTRSEHQSVPSSSRSRSPASSSSSSSSSAGGSQRIVRYYSLYGRCAERHVRMTSKLADCSALDTEDQYTQLRAVGDASNSQLRLQSVLSRTFLCFSQTGKLTVKHSGNSRSCLLREVPSADGGYVEFQSAVNSTWYVGFNKKGQRLLGDHYKVKPRLRKCYQFTKRSFHYLSPIDSKQHRARHRQTRHSASAKRAKERT